jgi:hypothetical protein
MTTAPEAGESGDTAPAADEFKPITSQDDLNKVISDRVARERAKYADYKDVKAKADRLDQLEKANQTEAEKAAARVAELEAELTNTRRETLRLKTAAEHGITDADDIELFLTGNDAETLTKQAQRLAGRDADRRKNGNHVPHEGTNPSADGGDERQVLRSLFADG